MTHQQALEQCLAAAVTPAALPADPDGLNGNRAVWAERALIEFMVATGSDAETAVRDLVANLGHWCDRHGQDFQEEFAIAQDYYAAETTAAAEEVEP